MHYRRPPEDSRSTAELVSLALRGDEEDENAWEAIHALHWRGSREVLVAAERLVHSPLASERGRGADILGQLGLPERTFPEECFRLLLSHLRDPRAVPELVKLKAHPRAEVRFGVVSGLKGQEHPEAIAALIELSGDPDEEVRNWATFELGDMVATDTPELREALLRRLTDSNAEVRGEALLGLARRKDARVLEPLQEALSAPNVLVLVVEAAMELRDRRVHPFLIRLRDRPGEADDYFQGVLDKAIESYEAPHPGGE
jgi:HEAT repeat protein